jgi:hypothetical protein
MNTTSWPTQAPVASWPSLKGESRRFWATALTWLLFLETKWASLMSYGMTAKLLQDVLPIEEPVNTFTIRQHVADVAERLEEAIYRKTVTVAIRSMVPKWYRHTRAV